MIRFPLRLDSQAASSWFLQGPILLTIQAQQPGPKLGGDRTPNRYQTVVLNTGFYGMADQGSSAGHGADQLDHANQRAFSSFFNWLFFSICASGFITDTVMVWVIENLGWSWSFGVSLICLSSALLVFIGGFPIYGCRLPG